MISHAIDLFLPVEYRSILISLAIDLFHKYIYYLPNLKVTLYLLSRYFKLWSAIMDTRASQASSYNEPGHYRSDASVRSGRFNGRYCIPRRLHMASS